MTEQVLVSYVVTVFNKEDTIADTAASLLNQSGEFDAEYIFVDDASTDSSISILEEIDDARIRIIRNSDNKGPSIRLNQGASLAKGSYLQFIDADDIMVRGATAEMLGILQKEQADVVYGKWRHSSRPPVELLEDELEPNLPYVVSDEPLNYVLTHRRIARMALMTTRQCFEASGGCDEELFIQDESLPLRVAWKAKRFIDYSGAIMRVPAPTGGNLSCNKVQLYHDGYCACWNAFREMGDLSSSQKRWLYRKAMSILWKHYRRELRGSPISSVFARYIVSKYCPPIPSEKLFMHLYGLFFANIMAIRKP